MTFGGQDESNDIPYIKFYHPGSANILPYIHPENITRLPAP